MDKKTALILVFILFFAASANASGFTDFFHDLFHDDDDDHHAHPVTPIINPVTNVPLPQALNVAIFPNYPKENETVYCSYAYFDALGKSEGATEIKWYKNGALTPYLGITLAPGTAKRLETWKCEVTPKSSDGRTGYARQSEERMIGFIASQLALSGIPDFEIAANKKTQTTIANLWLYASDSAFSPSQLEYTIVSETNTALIDCNVESNKFIACNAPATNSMGYSDINVQAKNARGNTASEVFRVSVLNHAPVIFAIPDQQVRKNSPAVRKLPDLLNYSFDAEQENSSLNYAIVSQSNSALINCYIDSNHFVDCNAPAANAVGTNIVRARISDSFGLGSERNFNVIVSSAKPQLASLPDPHLKKNSSSTSRIIDLWQFASDADNNKDQLAFTITNQTHAALINCFIDNNRYVSCSAPARNAIGLSIATVQVHDPDGATDSEQLNIFVEDYGFDFSFDKNSIILEQGQSAATIVSLKNNSTERNCYSLQASVSSRNNIEARLPEGMNSICLNADERTAFNFSVRAFNDADNDDYAASLTASDSKDSLKKSIDVEVNEDEKSIDLLAFKKNICKNKFNQTASVLVSNNSGETRTIELKAESELFIPSFEPEQIVLDAGDQEYVELKLNVNKTTATGNYSIPIIARTSEASIQSLASFSVITCEPARETSLDIIVPSGCISLEKGKSVNVSARIKNIGDELQNVSIAETSDLQATLSKGSAVIEPDSSVFVDMNVSAAANAKSGKRTLTIWVWSETERTGADVCIEVGKNHAIEIGQLNNNLEIPRDEAEIIAFNVKNNGDFSESVSVSVSNSYAKISVTTSKSSVTVASGAVETVFVVVSPQFDADLGDREITARFGTSNGTITKKINFTVVKEKTAQKLNVIKVLEYPLKIVAVPGTKKEFELTIENPTEDRIVDLNAIVSGLPAGANATAAAGIVLNPHETQKVRGTIEFTQNVQIGNYEAAFEIKNNDYKTIALFTATVETTTDGGTTGGLTGLFALGSSVLLGLIALALIVLIVAAIGSSSKAKKQPWQA